MRLAMASGHVRPEQVGYVNAHGTSTKLGDVAESVAIGKAFGANQPAVSSTKALTGHMLGTSGVVEAVAAVGAITTGLLPPTYHLDDPDPACSLDHIRKEPRDVRLEYALSNSFGFGGQNVSLLLGTATTPERRDINSEGKA
jgi:3-oxoacyl-[acyl-carrier-protein] synthase II